LTNSGADVSSSLLENIPLKKQYRV
jgi:hypothetical protein